ncbi:MAG: phosphoadenosine phosphosulfate reductase family protein, partial [Candidatus Thorarchaeota archaeon]
MKKKRTAPFLGALKLFWCDTCNLPILDRHYCSICNSKTRKVNMAPPGDIRPAFELDIVRISNIIDERFGLGSAEAVGLTMNRLVLLNGVSYDDLMDEIIIDGNIVGSLRYNLQLNDWEFYPRILGAQRIFENSLDRKKFIQMDAGAVDYIAKGFNILAPGIIDIDDNLKKGEAAVALGPDGKVLSTGTMRVNAKEVKTMGKGVVMKPKHSISDTPSEIIGNTSAANQTWEQAVIANEKTLANYEQRAIESIQKVTKNNPELPLSVSFSGGKDSLVCLQLARKTPETTFKVLFVNTSLEFPETIHYIDEVIQQFNLGSQLCRLDIPKEKFWTSVEKYGPPGKDYRYCCKILKIGPVNELIQNCVGTKTLSLVGQRAYESISRSESKILWSNPWIPNQLNFTPIQNWTALHVWLYILREKLPINPLYKEGFSRIGCWLCPACNQGTFEIIK